MTPTTNLSLSDRATWVMILSWLAPILTGAFGTDLSAYVPAAATIAAGLVTAGILIGKHHYAAAAGALAAGAAATYVTVPGTSATVRVEQPHRPVAAVTPPPVVTVPNPPPASPPEA